MSQFMILSPSQGFSFQGLLIAHYMGSLGHPYLHFHPLVPPNISYLPLFFVSLLCYKTANELDNPQWWIILFLFPIQSTHEQHAQ